MLGLVRLCLKILAFCIIPSVLVFNSHLANTRPQFPDDNHVIRMTSHGVDPYFVTVWDRNTLVALAFLGMFCLVSAVFLDLKWRGRLAHHAEPLRSASEPNGPR